MLAFAGGRRTIGAALCAVLDQWILASLLPPLLGHDGAYTSFVNK